MSVKITSLKERRSQRKTQKQGESNLEIIKEAQMFLQSFDQENASHLSLQKTPASKPPSAVKSISNTNLTNVE
jgi:hypothetical protein